MDNGKISSILCFFYNYQSLISRVSIALFLIFVIQFNMNRIYAIEFGLKLGVGILILSKGDYTFAYSADKYMKFYKYDPFNPSNPVPIDTINAEIYVQTKTNGKKDEQLHYILNTYCRINIANSTNDADYEAFRINLLGEINWLRYKFALDYDYKNQVITNTYYYKKDGDDLSTYNSTLSGIVNSAALDFKGAQSNITVDYINIPVLLEIQKFSQLYDMHKKKRNNTYILAGPSFSFLTSTVDKTSKPIDNMKDKLSEIFVIEPVYNGYTLESSKNKTEINSCVDNIIKTNTLYTVAVGWQFTDLFRTKLSNDVFIFEIRYNGSVSDFTKYKKPGKNSKINGLSALIGYEF